MPSEHADSAGWATAPLEQLTEGAAVTYGVVQPGAHVADGVPMLRVNNFRGYGLDTTEVLRIAPEVEVKYARTRLRQHDVLITVVGSVGQVAVVPKELQGWNLARAVALVRPRHKEMSRWFALCLRAPAAQHALGVAANTTVQTTINLKDLRKLQVPLPPTGERVAITEVLSALDDRIDLLRQTNATLEAIAQALFKSWFIDFDPVRAKAEGREPEGMDAATAALFPAEFEESALGSVPKGWRVGTVADLLVLQRGFDLPASKRTDGPFTVFAASGPHGTHSASMAAAPGVVTGRSGVIGRVFYVHESYWPLNTALWVKQFRAATPPYAFQYLQSMDLARLNAGSAVPTLNRNHVHAQSALIPPDGLVSAYTAVAVPLLERIRANSRQVNDLAALRDALLPRLISGKLRLPEARHRIEEATA